MKKYLIPIFYLFGSLFFYSLSAQVNTPIPDPNFEQALINAGIDKDGLNGQVLTDNINKLTALNIINNNIDSLNGIEAFVNLTTLNCSYNKLKKLNVNKNTALTSLNFSSNQISKITLSSNTNLTSLFCNSNKLDSLTIRNNVSLTKIDCAGNSLKKLDVSSNILLTSLTCASNQLDSLKITALTDLTSLDCSLNQLKVLNVANNHYLRTLICADNQLSNLNTSANDSLTFIGCSNNQLKSLNLSNNVFLTYLSCSSNQLTSLSLTENDSLTFLSCANNQFKSLNVSNNLALENLICASNQLSSIDISKNIALTKLDIASNLLTNLNVSNDTVLTSLNCSGNQLKDLNVRNNKNNKIVTFNATNNPHLRCIKVDDPPAASSNVGWQKDATASYNQDCNATTYVPDNAFEQALINLGYDSGPLNDFVITSSIDTITYLNISRKNINNLTGIEGFKALDSLDCSHNLLTNLDMSNQSNLRYLNCDSNKLVALTLKNKLNGVLKYLKATNNPKLTCIKVDDVSAANGELKWYKDATASYNLNCTAGKTYIPDDNFEQALIDLGYDQGSFDDYVVTDSIKTITNLNVSNKGIFDFTGIQSFLGLEVLNCSSNKLSVLDISKNVALKKLTCFSNYLTKVNTRLNTSLTHLNCGDNKLDSLDISKNIILAQLVCDANNLTELNTSKNSKLTDINCNSNHISTGLDVSKDTLLVQLFCSYNELIAIDLTKNKKLEVFVCTNNHLSTLNLSNDSSLIKLDCSNNFLKSLNVSSNIKLVDINCNSNQIASLALNTNTLLRNLSADDNLLTSINISANDSLRNISANTNKLQKLVVSGNPFLRTLNCSGNQLDSLNVSINDSLVLLNCTNNKISELLLSNNLTLQNLNCEYNQLKKLNIRKNNLLTNLSCSNNKLDSLNVSSNPLLLSLNADKNLLTELNTSNNDTLQMLSCSGNYLKALNLNSNIYLTSFVGSSNKLTSLSLKNGNNTKLTTFNVTGNTDLTCIEVDNPIAASKASGWQKNASASYSTNCHYAETYIPNDAFEQALIGLGYDSGSLNDYVATAAIDTITNLNVSGKNISNLTGIKDFVALKSLNCSRNHLDSMDIKTNIALTILHCANNNLSKLDVSNNGHLETLNFSSNKIKAIDLNGLTSLKSLNCDSNELANLELTHNVALTSFSGLSNKLTSINARNNNNIKLTAFAITGNPYLTCIEVDNPIFSSSAAGWQKDAIATYTANCHYNQTYIPDDAFEKALQELGYDNSGTEPLDDYVPTSKINKITSLPVGNQEISNFTGIQDFTNLISFDCSNNKLLNLDISNNKSLKEFDCSGNKLTNLVLSANTALTKLYVANNLLTNLDISANIGIIELYCSLNQLTSLDIKHNINLRELSCYSNQLFSLDVNNGHNASLLNFDLRNNPNLRCVLVDNISAAQGNSNWLKDPLAQYKLVCNDDDNDGIVDTADNCLTTPFGDFVDLFGCSVFKLPVNNFSIQTIGESCRSSNNGKINVAAIKTYNYKVAITGDATNSVHNFTNTLEIRNLRSGNYQLCITITEVPAYINCYDVFISEPEELSVLSSISAPDETVLFKMSGGTNYNVDLNGLIFNTIDNNITLKLDKGKNIITIKTDAACQGIHKETIFLSNNLVFYPNPFEDFINVYIGKDDSKEVQINIYSYLGQLVLSNQYPVQGGLVHIEAAHLAPGIYIVSLKSTMSQSTFEIIKK